MNDKYLMIRIGSEKKQALKDRAWELRIEGGMSELVMRLINQELSKPARASLINPEPKEVAEQEVPSASVVSS